MKSKKPYIMKTFFSEKTEKFPAFFILLFLLTIDGFSQEVISKSNSSFQNITFRVDMSERVVSPFGVHLVGSFCNWVTDSLEMTLADNNIYQLTLSLPAGTTQEYKFLNGNSWNGGDEYVPAACGVPNGSGGFNRYITVPSQDSVLKVVCFQRCDLCPPTVGITFRVSMAGQTISPAGVHIGGTFNSWNPSTTLLDQAGNGSVYQVTLPVASGDSVLFRYVNGVDWTGGEQVPSACGVYGSSNTYSRLLVVPASLTILPVVCFSLCTDFCAVGMDAVGFEGIGLSQNVPNPFSESTLINYTVSEKSAVSLVIFDIMSRPVMNLVNKEMEAGSYHVELHGSILVPGVYSCRMTVGNTHGFKVFTKQMVVMQR
jgi:hypothetical protein